MYKELIPWPGRECVPECLQNCLRTVGPRKVLEAQAQHFLELRGELILSLLHGFCNFFSFLMDIYLHILMIDNRGIMEFSTPIMPWFVTMALWISVLS